MPARLVRVCAYRIALMYPMLAALTGCQDGSRPLPGETIARTPPAFSGLSECTLGELRIEKNGRLARDADFERINRAMTWHFTVSSQSVRSLRQAPGAKPVVFDVPVVDAPPGLIVAEGPAPVEFGRMQKRVEIARAADGAGRHRVVQRRVWKLPDGPPGTLMPFHGWSEHVVTWELSCAVDRQRRPDVARTMKAT